MNCHTLFPKKLAFFFLSFLTSIVSYSATIKGVVKDKYSQEPLVATTLLLKGTKFGASSGLDGSYALKNIPVGRYELVARFLGYQVQSMIVEVRSANQVLVINFDLSEQSHELSETVVKAKGNQGTDESARKTELKSDNVLNIISAKTIELLPDITVGNVLQRVSGVSVVRNSTGDGQYAVIRGMDKRYNYSTRVFSCDWIKKRKS